MMLEVRLKHASVCLTKARKLSRQGVSQLGSRMNIRVARVRSDSFRCTGGRQINVHVRGRSPVAFGHPDIAGTPVVVRATHLRQPYWERV